jgi:hypothetical protein
MRHKAKVDWWIGALTIFALMVPFFSAVTTSTPWGYAGSILTAVVIAGFCYPQWYETTADALIIRAGLTTRRIPYSSITAVRPSSDMRSSFALYLDRVEIEYDGKKLLIAPADKDAFFADLAARVPGISRPVR